LHQTLATAVARLDPDWDERFGATRLLVARESALLRYVEHNRAGIRRQVVATLASKLGLDPEDVRLPVLTGLATAAFTRAARPWVYDDRRGGRKGLLDRHRDAVKAIPASLVLVVPASPPRPGNQPSRAIPERRQRPKRESRQWPARLRN
jgi:hypothetical protein